MSATPAITSLEELFAEAKRAHRYALPMPRAKVRGPLSPDDTRFYLRRAEAELKEERFPLRVVPPGGLHFPAPSREQHREDGAFWSCAWTVEGVVRALRAGAFFVSGHHDFADRAAGRLALSPSMTHFRDILKTVESEETAIYLVTERKPRPSRLDPDELLKELLVQPSEGEPL